MSPETQQLIRAVRYVVDMVGRGDLNSDEREHFGLDRLEQALDNYDAARWQDRSTILDALSEGPFASELDTSTMVPTPELSAG